MYVCVRAYVFVEEREVAGKVSHTMKRLGEESRWLRPSFIEPISHMPMYKERIPRTLRNSVLFYPEVAGKVVPSLKMMSFLAVESMPI
jgi:hypothetical protein